ncbi:MAG: hypothetical protein ACLFWD_06025 [Anaerolineales bacterium]
MTSPKRPKLVTALSLGVLILATLQLARFALSLSLPPLPLSIPPIYLTLTGGLWGLGSLVAVWGLFTGRPWAPGYTRWGMAAYTLWYWVDRLLFVQSAYARETIPASIGITIILLAAGYGTLHISKVREYYGEEKDEQRSQT